MAAAGDGGGGDGDGNGGGSRQPGAGGQGAARLREVDESGEGAAQMSCVTLNLGLNVGLAFVQKSLNALFIVHQALLLLTLLTLFRPNSVPN